MAAVPSQHISTAAEHISRPTLHGRHVLITGASKGIGWAIAQAFAACGATLSLTARDHTLLEKRRTQLSADHDAACSIFQADLTNAAAAAAMVSKAAARHGPVDILVNNAGSGLSQPFAKMTDAHWGEMLVTNLTSVFRVTRAAIEGMLQRNDGRIINIASTAGLTGYAYVAAYCAAKHGVVGFTRALAREYAKTGITVNAICPGYVDTDMTTNTIETIVRKTGRSAEEAQAELARNNPQGRLIQPEEVAETALWLASPAARSITGQCIAVAGGEVMS